MEEAPQPEGEDDFADFPDDPLGDHCRNVNSKLNQLRTQFNLDRWDKICLRRVYDWAGHVARFGSRQKQRYAWKALEWRGIQYLKQLERLYGHQCHHRSFKTWRWEHQFVRILGPEWQKLAQDSETWADYKELWLSKRLHDDKR